MIITFLLKKLLQIIFSNQTYNKMIITLESAINNIKIIFKINNLNNSNNMINNLIKLVDNIRQIN